MHNSVWCLIKLFCILQTIKGATDISYGWSYILGWISMGLSSVAAILFLCAAYSFAQAEMEDRRPLKNHHPRQEYNNKPYHEAYDPYPPQVQPPAHYGGGAKGVYPAYAVEPYDYPGYRY